MLSHEIENWALSIIDTVKAVQPVEDSRVELKGEWPNDPVRAARRIAGHANAARGGNILWLIGVDESAGVNGVSYVEMSAWWSQVSAQFSDMPPAMTDINIRVDGITVAALLFETDRAPYVVKNVTGNVTLEVPWREGTAVRSAKRSELLRLLSPLQRIPQVELLGGDLTYEPVTVGDAILSKLDLRLRVFLYNPSDARVVVPAHRCKVVIRMASLPAFGPYVSDAIFRGGLSGISEDTDLMSIVAGRVFQLQFGSTEGKQSDFNFWNKPAEIELKFQLPGFEMPIVLMARMESDGATTKGGWKWEFLGEPRQDAE